jgi:hypothetical protein
MGDWWWFVEERGER